MAGLLAARVLAEHIGRVTVVDRDVFPEQPEHRSGVPQSHHAHALLGRGQIILEQLFPGLMGDLRAAGALSVHGTVPIEIVSAAGKLPSMPVAGEFLAFSRFLLEWQVRRRLEQWPGIRFLSGSSVSELIASADGTRVTGVRLQGRGSQAASQELLADLIVDASGRGSQAPYWLQALGYDIPPEETISSDLGYASRFYQRPADFPAPWQGVIVNVRPPHNSRVGLILPIEHGRWHVTLGGIGGHYPPTDEQGFLQWARDLSDPGLYEAIRVAQPISPIRGYRTPTNRLRHFEQLERWPRGLIVTGDAVCAFNPIYGQGMTVSALDALALQACLAEHGPDGLDFERAFQRAVAETARAPWLVATGEDLRWSAVKLSGASRPAMRLMQRYMDLVLRQATEDRAVAGVYMAVIAMMAPPEALLQRWIARRALAGAARRLLGGVRREPAWLLSPEATAILRERQQRHYAH
jgi:2-polyprenyl-6-methoxyphenol hydroxylase-like FAD-dependent oxidoreductase